MIVKQGKNVLAQFLRSRKYSFVIWLFGPQLVLACSSKPWGGCSKITRQAKNHSPCNFFNLHSTETSKASEDLKGDLLQFSYIVKMYDKCHDCQVLQARVKLCVSWQKNTLLLSSDLKQLDWRKQWDSLSLNDISVRLSTVINCC